MSFKIHQICLNVITTTTTSAHERGNQKGKNYEWEKKVLQFSSKQHNITKHKTINISFLPVLALCCMDTEEIFFSETTPRKKQRKKEENVIIVWTTSGCKKHWNLLWKIIIRIHIANNNMTYSQFSYRRNGRNGTWREKREEISMK